MTIPSTINITNNLGLLKASETVLTDSNMDDWYVSYNPRFQNATAEGTWAHWVELANAILEVEKDQTPLVNKLSLKASKA